MSNVERFVEVGLLAKNNGGFIITCHDMMLPQL